MEKNGMLTLTNRDMDLYKKGEVSPRLSTNWELDFNSLDGIIKAGSFELVVDKTNDQIEINTENKSGENK